MQIRDIILKQQNRFEAKQDKQLFRRAVLTTEGGLQTSTDPFNEVWASQNEARVWYMADGSTQPAQVLCRRVSNPYVGLGVIIGFAESSNEKEVLTTDFFLTHSGNISGWDSTGPQDLEPGGLKQMWIYSKTILPLATYPNSGLLVDVIAGDYPYQSNRVTFNGYIGFDLSASVPGAGLCRYVGLYLDSANTLQLVDGATTTAGSTPAEPSWPTGTFRLCVVLLTDGDTDIDFANIYDRRMAWSDENSGGNVWARPGKANIGSIEYDTITDACAAAVADDLIIAGAGIFDETFTLPEDVNPIGSGKGITIIATSDAGPVITIGATSTNVISNLTISNTGAGEGIETSADYLYLDGVEMLGNDLHVIAGTVDVYRSEIDTLTVEAGAIVNVYVNSQINGTIDSDGTVKLYDCTWWTPAVAGSGTIFGTYFYAGVSKRWLPLIDADGIGDQQDIDIFRFGLIMDYAGNQQTTIAFDGTNTFTLTPTGTTWDYYRDGIKYTVTGSKTLDLSGSPPAAAGLYYVVIDDTDGTLSASTSSWTLTDTKLPVVSILWNNSLTPKYWIADERHTCSIDRRFHWEHHLTDGTEVWTNASLSGYTVAPSSPADTDNTFGISASTIIDEDLLHSLGALTDPNGTATDYVIFFPSAGAWNWEASAMPYRYTAAGYIQYNAAGTMTQGQGNKYYNTYLLLTNLEGAARFTFIHGSSEFSTLALAQAERFSDVYKTGLIVNEYVAVYQLTWQTSAAYSTKGKARLAATPIPITVSSTGVSSGGTIEHNSLAGLQGGTSGEYYHLTETIYNTVVATQPISVLNTSSATATAGDVGYLEYTASSGIEYKTTTTAIDAKAERACVVIIGGANNTTIKVATRGRYTIPYAGSAPSAGDYLVFSTTAGKTQQQTTMRPEVLAVAMAAGAGGTVDALLLTLRVFQPLTNANDIWYVASSGVSNWTGTINGTPSGTSVVYTTTGGTNAASIVPQSSSQITKLVLHNTTRGNSAYISSVNTGTSTITLTATVPGSWANGDTITCRSQTNTGTAASSYYYELAFTGTDIPVLTTAIQLATAISDSGGAGQYSYIHPFQTYSISKLTGVFTQSTAFNNMQPIIGLFNNRFTALWSASGSGTMSVIYRLRGIWVATP